MLGVYTIVKPGRRARLDRRPHARPRRHQRGAARRVRASGRRRRRNPLMPLRDLPLAQPGRREPDPGAGRRRHVRHVLPRLAVPAARPRLRRAADRAGVPAGRRWSWATLSVRYSERLITRFGARHVLLAGLALIAAGLALFALAPADAQLRDATCCRSWCCSGIGAGLCFPALMTLAMSGVAPHDAGLASGLVNTTAQVGGALGLAVLATLSSTRTGSCCSRASPGRGADRRLPPGVLDRRRPRRGRRRDRPAGTAEPGLRRGARGGQRPARRRGRRGCRSGRAGLPGRLTSLILCGSRRLNSRIRTRSRASV